LVLVLCIVINQLPSENILIGNYLHHRAGLEASFLAGLIICISGVGTAILHYREEKRLAGIARG
jgi:hypothetical protein